MRVPHCVKRLILVLLVVGFPTLAAAFYRMELLCPGVLDGRHLNSLYGALAQIFASLLGFCIAAISIVLGYAHDDRLAFLRRSKHYRELWGAFMRAIRWLAVAALVNLVGLFVQTEETSILLLAWVAGMSSLYAIYRLAHCVRVLDGVIRVVTREDTSDDLQETVLADRHPR